MTRSTFNNSLMLGFEHMERMLDRANRTSDSYPPYNIEHLSESNFRITVAVAGFTMKDLNVNIEDNQLVIKGMQEDEGLERHYIHRGIASRQFQKAFVLAEGVEVERAWLENGLLNVDLIHIRPDPLIRNIKIENID
ncbi:MAG: Hsp20 family protein [Alphaproteobacteria bacterium]